MFLRNCWYVAARDSEVHRLQLTRRILLEEPVVLYRKSDGRVVAPEDRCCHRHAPLSMGRIKGDDVECRYHGLRFDPGGRCIHIPWQENIPSGARVRSYPVVEKYHWNWIWMSDPALADVDFQLVHGAFLEDLALIKAQQENIDLAPAATRLNIVTDTGGIMARRIVERLIRQEQKAAQSMAAS